MAMLAFLLTQSLNALSQAALLFFLGVGLTLIFGIMRIVNFAHGTFYMLGAFIGYSAAAMTGSFWTGLIAGPLVAAAIGSAFEVGLLRRLYKRDTSAFLMVTFGLTLVLGEIIRLIWGVNALQLQMPDSLSGVVFLLDEPFPVYRLFLAAAGGVVAVGIWQFLERTRLGLLIRAASQNGGGDMAVPGTYAAGAADPRDQPERRNGACAGNRREHGSIGHFRHWLRPCRTRRRPGRTAADSQPGYGRKRHHRRLRHRHHWRHG